MMVLSDKILVSLVFSTLLAACATPEIVPLLGEDPEVGVLLGKGSVDDPRSSPVAAARRLHQALVQQDTETVWALLSDNTKKALDERGTAIASSGRELIDESTLPGPGGTVRKVRYETIFFGPRLTDLKELPGDRAEGPGALRKVIATSDDGGETTVQFILEGDGWKLDQTGF